MAEQSGPRANSAKAAHFSSLCPWRIWTLRNAGIARLRLSSGSGVQMSLSEPIEDPARHSNVGSWTGENHQFRPESPTPIDEVAQAATDVEVQICGAARHTDWRQYC